MRYKTFARSLTTVLLCVTSAVTGCSCPSPLGPLTRTVSWPAPAPRVSQMKWLRYVARIPCSMPGPLTFTLLASGAPDTLMWNGLPANSTPSSAHNHMRLMERYWSDDTELIHNMDECYSWLVSYINIVGNAGQWARYVFSVNKTL